MTYDPDLLCEPPQTELSVVVLSTSLGAPHNGIQSQSRSLRLLFSDMKERSRLLLIPLLAMLDPIERESLGLHSHLFALFDLIHGQLIRGLLLDKITPLGRHPLAS